MSDVLPEGRFLRAPGLRRLGLGALAVLVTIALVGSLLVVRARAASHLLLVVDGRSTTVVTDAATVAELLAEQGVLVGPRDRVTPDLTADLGTTAQVDVAFGRRVQLTVDDATHEVWTTSTDVGGLLAQEAVPGEAYVSLPAIAPLARTGARLTVRTPKHVTVRVGGRSVPLVTTAATVGEALAQGPVTLGPDDRVSASARAAVVEGATYTVTRVRLVDRTDRTLLRAQTRWVRRADLPVGTTRVIATGRDGVQEKRVRARYVDGTQVRREVRTRVLSRAVDWVIGVGTRSSGSQGSGATGSDVKITYPKQWTPATGKVDGEPDFAALAKCESGGNPRAVSPTGKYRGLYQFDLRTWHGVGGVGDPIDASPAEQTKRARILYNDRGRAPWPYCGRYL